MQNYAGIVIVVSHDRTFINKVCKRTIEITLGKIEDYNCDYSTYVQRRQERIAHQKQVVENQQKKSKPSNNLSNVFAIKHRKPSKYKAV